MKKVRIGSVGLGRLGYEHAKNIATQIPGTELAAICDVNQEQAKKVADEFGVEHVYSDFEEMCSDPTIDAVAIVTPSFLHTQQIDIAMKHGKHVFCEKPLGTDVAQCKDAEKVVEAHPDLIFQLGFMRRFDPSYAEAKKKVDAGVIGKVVLVRSYTQDPRATIESTLKFVPHSGGQFLDMCVHDIDLVRWFTGANVKNVWGLGGAFEFDVFRELHDADNAVAVLQMDNDTVGFIFANRTYPAGSNIETEIVGTKGTLRIGNTGAKNLLQIVDENGPHEEYYQDFLTRWHGAFIAEMAAFADHVRNHTKPSDLTVYDGTAVSEAAARCKESYETGKVLPIR